MGSTDNSLNPVTVSGCRQPARAYVRMVSQNLYRYLLDLITNLAEENDQLLL